MPANRLHPLNALLGLDPTDLTRQIERRLSADAERQNRLWSYYRNPMRPTGDASADRPYRQAQEWGLPRRIKGDPADHVQRKEVVIENDIRWRIDVMVDFLFGGELTIASAAPDPVRRATITALLNQILSNHGGTVFLQHLATIGAVHGHVDVLVKLLPDSQHSEPSTRADPPTDALQTPLPQEPAPRGDSVAPASPPPDVPSDSTDPGASTCSLEAADRLARRIRIEIVEPARALPLHDPLDQSVLRGFVQVFHLPGPQETGPNEPHPLLWFKRLFATSRGAAPPVRHTRLEVITPHRWFTVLDDRIIAQGRNSLGQIPLAHIQNIPAPFQWAGNSDVEPLIPLQDEINTRLSDRAHRITMQSFRMYLGKGIDNFTEQTISPGRMWMSDNPDAQIIEFGGDADCPSEDAHLRELREAMDKTSGVTPIAAGILRHRIGHLTSAAALRVTMMNLLARTRRKRATYAAGIRRICELALQWLHCAELFPSTTAEREIRITWPEPIPFGCDERASRSDAACDFENPS